MPVRESLRQYAPNGTYAPLQSQLQLNWQLLDDGPWLPHARRATYTMAFEGERREENA